jgi:hypothetical protein
MADGQARDAAANRPLRDDRRRAPARNFLIAGFFVTLFGIAGAIAYEVGRGSEQDQCSFGPVSNARYREWLAEARALRRREGNLISHRRVQVQPGHPVRLATDLFFDELSNGITSVEERIAIVHAMMRADGFELLATEPDSEDPYAAAESIVGFKYGKYSVLGLLLLCRFDCLGRAFASLYLEDRPGAYRKNEIRFSYGGGPDLVSLTRYHVPPPRFPRTCPPLPSPEWAARLIAPKNTQ